MGNPLDTPSSANNSSHPEWLTGVAADAYPVRAKAEQNDTGSGLGEFAKDHWKEIGGVGLAVVAGTAFVVGRKYGLSPLVEMLKGGEAATALEKGVAEGPISRLKNVDHFVFDMDRTLVDHDGSLAALTHTMTEGLTKSSGLSREFISDAIAQTAKRLDSPYFFNRLDEIKPLQEHFPGVDLNHKFADVAIASRQAYYDALKAKPETVELLDLIRNQGKGVHVFSAGTPTRSLEKLNAAGLLGKVDTIYTSGANAFEDSGAARLMTKEVSPVKLFALPHEAKATGSGYEFIANDLRTKGERLAMTGDNPIEDIAHAKTHNYFTTLAQWYKQSKPVTPPDLELTAPSQFTELLKKRIFN